MPRCAAITPPHCHTPPESASGREKDHASGTFIVKPCLILPLLGELPNSRLRRDGKYGFIGASLGPELRRAEVDFDRNYDNYGECE